ncbi:MAG: T9SS type A sorting domain-containing protein [Lewinellaceae bacterium]|nr:T9SS type A sorting domain-containing protein [Lewinellaceae bacterium]
MFKSLSIGLAAMYLACSLSAQTTTDQISSGPNYSKTAFYKLSDGSSTQINHDAWDLAFTNLGLQHAGVLANESAISSMGNTGPELAAFDPFIFDFGQQMYVSELNEDSRIYNPEASWAIGAFNTGLDTTNVDDYGWGLYDTQQSKIIGYRVFGLQLRNGTYKKISIDEYDGLTWKFRIADLDGSNETQHTLTPGTETPIALFSLSGNAPTPPDNWDLMYCRYNALLPVGSDFLPHVVTGILGSEGLLTAKASGVNPSTVNYEDYLDSLSTRLDVIGHDWKTLNGFSWLVPADRAYFVKQTDGKLYKLVFTAFAGSTTGNATLQRTYLTQLSAAPDLPEGILDVAVFPNPASDHVYLSLTAKRAEKASFALLSLDGKTLWSGQSAIQAGLNVLEINGLPSLPRGNYMLQVKIQGTQFTRMVQFR